MSEFLGEIRRVWRKRYLLNRVRERMFDIPTCPQKWQNTISINTAIPINAQKSWNVQQLISAIAHNRL